MQIHCIVLLHLCGVKELKKMSKKKITTDSVYIIITEVIAEGCIILNKDKQEAENIFQQLIDVSRKISNNIINDFFGLIETFDPVFYNIYGDSNVFSTKNTIQSAGNGLINFTLFEIEKSNINIALLLCELSNTNSFNVFDSVNYTEYDNNKQRIDKFCDVYEEMFEYDIILN